MRDSTVIEAGLLLELERERTRRRDAERRLAKLETAVCDALRDAQALPLATPFSFVLGIAWDADMDVSDVVTLERDALEGRR